ncbi:MAG TPA: hypothetical protein VHA52_06265, partial [Candidatus Babeliaceae bacterium]|nr:hypothetical protein [Candidatus Babeliaceae bacterium]
METNIFKLTLIASLGFATLTTPNVEDLKVSVEGLALNVVSLNIGKGAAQKLAIEDNIQPYLPDYIPAQFLVQKSIQLFLNSFFRLGLVKKENESLSTKLSNKTQTKLKEKNTAAYNRGSLSIFFGDSISDFESLRRTIWPGIASKSTEPYSLNGVNNSTISTEVSVSTITKTDAAKGFLYGLVGYLTSKICDNTAIATIEKSGLKLDVLKLILSVDLSIILGSLAKKTWQNWVTNPKSYAQLIGIGTTKEDEAYDFLDQSFTTGA